MSPNNAKNIYPLLFQFLQEGARIQAQLTLSLTTLAKTKEKYDKAFGASEKALEAYNKADADLNLSRWAEESICWPRRNTFVQGWCGETADELQHQEAADGRQQEWVRKPVAENQRASGECKREWVMRLIKDLICPPPVYHYTCDQHQIGDTTSLVTVPGCQEYQLLSLNCEIPIALSHIKNDFADWETWILQMLTLCLDHKRSHLFILRDS